MNIEKPNTVTNRTDFYFPQILIKPIAFSTLLISYPNVFSEKTFTFTFPTKSLHINQFLDRYFISVVLLETKSAEETVSGQ
jgi:hypothetical protein